MKKELLVLWVTGILIFLSSCASLHKSLSKKEMTNAVHAKIDSREYRIDMNLGLLPVRVVRCMFRVIFKCVGIQSFLA